MEQETERFFLLTPERLAEAFSRLTPVQERRIRASFMFENIGEISEEGCMSK